MFFETKIINSLFSVTYTSVSVHFKEIIKYYVEYKLKEEARPISKKFSAQP